MLAVFGALGSVTRYILDRSIMRTLNTAFPFGTLTINLTGSLLLGLLVGISANGLVSKSGMVAIGDGFVGAYTTFSTLTFESIALTESGALNLAVLNLVATILASTLLAYIGLQIGWHLLV